MVKKNKITVQGIVPPQKTCDDDHCPFHGMVTSHGRTFRGEVIKKNLHKTVSVEWPRIVYMPKFERYARSRTRLKAHNPPCIDANVGDRVTIVETRPISKTKHFVVVEVQK